MNIPMPSRSQWVHAAKLLLGAVPALAAALVPGFTSTQTGAAFIATAVAWAGEFVGHGKSGPPTSPVNTTSSAMPQ